MLFGKIIGIVVGTFAPIDNELPLSDAVANPVKAHVHGFGSLLFDGVVGETDCTSVICLYWGWRLLVPQVFQSIPYLTPLFSVVKQCPKFCFRGG
jgi:hypothetical protein